MQRKKLKVALICHVSNATIREHLSLDNWKLKNIIKRLLGLPISNYRDYSIWNTLLFQQFKEVNDIELHAIIPHPGLKGKRTDFVVDNIHYHCFRQTGGGRIWAKIMSVGHIKKNVFKRFRHNVSMIRKIVDEIQPDVINMIGAECPFYTLVGLEFDINKVPFILTLQTALSDPDFLKNYPMESYIYEDNVQVEQALFKHCHYIAHDSYWYREVAVRYNPTAQFLRYTFFMPKYDIDTNVKKEFDFVYYAANISKAGADAIEAFGLAYKENPNLTLNIIGDYSASTYIQLMSRVRELGFERNVTFSGYFPTHIDALRQVVKSRYGLVPIKIDLISGTIIECIILGLPVVTFKTKGTPRINDNGEAVLLSDIGDYQDMANNMLRLVNDETLGRSMVKKAREFYANIWELNQATHRLTDIYHSVYENFHNGSEIPAKLVEPVY